MVQKRCNEKRSLNIVVLHNLVKNTVKCSCSFIPDHVSKLIKLSLVHQIRFINYCQISKGYLPEKRERSTNRSLAVSRSLVCVCAREREKKQSMHKRPKPSYSFSHSLYYHLQIPYSLIYAKDCACVCLEA